MVDSYLPTNSDYWISSLRGHCLESLGIVQKQHKAFSNFEELLVRGGICNCSIPPIKH